MHQMRQRELGEEVHLQHVQRPQACGGGGEDWPWGRFQRERDCGVQGARQQ